MNKRIGSTQDKGALRRRAKEQLASRQDAATDGLMTDEKKLLHELQVHQIELEMQNEALLQAQILLEASRDECRDLYDFAPVGYLTLNSVNLIAEINLTAASMLGIERKRLILQPFFYWIANESRDFWHRYFLHLNQTGGKQSCELIMQRDDGSTFHARLDCCLAASQEQNPSVRIALSDISENKLMEQRMKDADQRKDEFLAMLAHELRNPLAPIRNAVEIQKIANNDSALMTWCASIIDRQLEHLTGLVNDLLDVTRISRGLIELKKETLEIRDFIQSALEANQPLIDSRGQEFSIMLPNELLWVEGDRIRLAQIVSNLINNASKYTKEGGCIGLSVELAGDDVCIRVSDNGSGIDPADLTNLFDMFYQADRSLDRSQGGLGIGLSLVQTLVKKHGGEVRAFSAGRGLGSEFVVRLPRSSPPDISTVAAPPLKIPYPGD